MICWTILLKYKGDDSEQDNWIEREMKPLASRYLRKL